MVNANWAQVSRSMFVVRAMSSKGTPYSPGMMKATLSRMVLSVASSAPFSSGTDWKM